MNNKPDPIESFLQDVVGALNIQRVATSISNGTNPIFAGRTVGEEDRLVVVTSGLRYSTLHDGLAVADRRAELLINLPAEWVIGSDDDKDCTWLIEWLDSLVNDIRERRIYLGEYKFFMNGESMSPLGPETEQSCFLALGKSTIGHEIEVEHGEKATLYTLMPVYAEEREMEKANGLNSLLELFEEHDITEVVDLRRMNVALAPPPWL